MAQHLRNYGESIVESIKKDRLYIKLKETDDENELVLSLIETIKNNLNIDLNLYEQKMVTKENTSGFNMKWHLDDAVPFYNKNGYHKEYNVTELTDTLYIYHKQKLPLYSAIIYLSDHGVDFSGGVFNFVDATFEPKKYHTLFFSSREVHRVDMITKGIRKNILIKFYEKDK
jgi:hypothetical protein